MGVRRRLGGAWEGRGGSLVGRVTAQQEQEDTGECCGAAGP